MFKRKSLSLLEKQNLIKKYDSLPSCNQREAASSLGVTQSTLCKILKDRNKILAFAVVSCNLSRKRKREGKAADVEKALLQWFCNAKEKNAPINRAILSKKAEHFAKMLGVPDFNVTEGWLTRWKERNNIVYKKCYGEKKDADSESASLWIEAILSPLLKKYAPHQVFNTDETGLYFRAMPEHTMMFKNDFASAGKKQKDRITVLLTTNMTGTVKKTPLIIGKSKNPKCLKGIKQLPVVYENSKNAWMTSRIFTNFLLKWDRELVGKEKVLLVLDNCPAHPEVQLENIELCFLPPRTTSEIQPLDQGIIKTFKTLYRSDMRQKIVDAIDDGKGVAAQITKEMTLLDSIHMVAKAWKSVSNICIFNCFRKAGFFHNSNEDILEGSEEIAETTNVFEEWVRIDENLQTSEEKTDEDIVNEIKYTHSVQENEIDSEDEDGDANEQEFPTVKQSREALEIIRRTLECRGATENTYGLFYDLEKHVNNLFQTSLKTLDKYLSCV